MSFSQFGFGSHAVPNNEKKVILLISPNLDSASLFLAFQGVAGCCEGCKLISTFPNQPKREECLENALILSQKCQMVRPLGHV